MAAKHHRHVALTEPRSRFSKDEVAEGRYVSASEVVRADRRMLIKRKKVSTLLMGKDNQPHG
jgi:antitoxin ParD1/3/4